MLVAPSWVIVTSWPAMLMTSVRVPSLVFGAKAYVGDPLPWPVRLDVIVIHDAGVSALHGQGACVRTSMRPVPPHAGIDAAIG